MSSTIAAYRYETRPGVAALDGPAQRRFSALEPWRQRAVVLWLCWRGLWRWEAQMARGIPNPDFGGGPAGDPHAIAIVAREALVALGNARATPDELSARFGEALAGYQDGPVRMHRCGQPVLGAIHNLLSCRPDEAVPTAVLLQALAALEPDGAGELTAAVQQLQPRPGHREAPGTALGVCFEATLVILHVLVVFAVLAVGLNSRGEKDVMGVVMGLVLAPAAITALRTPFRRRRFVAFALSGLLCLLLMQSSSGWVLVLGLMWLVQ